MEDDAKNIKKYQLEKMNKDELFEFGEKHFGLALDRATMNRNQMIDSILIAQAGEGIQTGDESEPEAEDKPDSETPATEPTETKDADSGTEKPRERRMKNIKTGVEWPYSPAYAKNPDLVEIE